MARYILHTSNPDGPTPDELDLIGQQTTVLDKSRRALLVEVDEPNADKLARQLPGWTVQPEVILPIPDTKRKLK
ncbi:hypothetical protein A6C57_18550 [Fibrella sp. ES10-3-2-2]|nr:hypothetical protein A6C57_18550 [Fibrella sp. ES10-3-2-2]